MSFGTYRQYDSRWGNRNYNGSSSYATAACGSASCANILHAIDPKITPLTTGKYMQTHGYAIRNQGTSWNGIPACLKHFGAYDVRKVDAMADVFKYCAKGYVGVFLFVGGSRGGVTWTTSGHFVAVTGYKYKNKKHYFKTFDSGGRKHDGWYCYETQMRGLIRRIWLCKVSEHKDAPKPKGAYTGSIAMPTLKKSSRGAEVIKLQKFFEWYFDGVKFKRYGTFGEHTEKVQKRFQKAHGLKQTGVYGTSSYKKASAYKNKPKTTNAQKMLKKMDELAWAYGTAKKKYDYKTGAPKKVCKEALKKYGWADSKAEMSDCGNNVSAVVRESGVDKNFKALHGTKTPFPKSEDKFNIVHKGKKIKGDILKPGDIVRYKKTNGNQHALFYYGKGKVCEASHHNRYFAIVKDTQRYNTQSKESTIQVLRAKE